MAEAVSRQPAREAQATTPALGEPSPVGFTPLGSTAAWKGSLRGVQAQFDEGWDPDVLDAAVAAGVAPTFVRFNFIRKASTEPSPGTYDFSQYSPALAKMHRLGIRHTMTVFYGSAPWDGDFAGFAAWALAAAAWEEQNYSGTLAVVEIWNEPDGTWPVSTADYLKMAHAVHDALRAHPELDHIKLAGAATYAADLPYWKDLIAGGILDLIDVVSTHKYGSPESLTNDLAPLRAALATAGRPDMPIYLSEWGAYGINVEQIARRLTLMKALSLFASAYFPLRDYRAWPVQGLLTSAGGEKPQVNVWREWYNRIGDQATFVGRDELNSVAYSYIFKRAAAIVRHMWAVVDTPVLIDGSPVLLTIVPIYVTGDVTVALDSAGDVLLAALKGGFTLEAQGKPFFYLGRDNDGARETAMVANLGAHLWQYPADPLCYARSDAHQAPTAAHKAVRRWIAPSDGRIKIRGGVARSQAGGDGTDIRILHGSEERFERVALQKAAGVVPLLQVFDVRAGDRIEFEVGAGGSATSDDVVWKNVLIYATLDPITAPDLAESSDDRRRLP